VISPNMEFDAWMMRGIQKMVRSHRDLMVWGLAMDLTVEVYKLAKVLPKDELCRLTAQVTRAAVSVPANIAEGNGRGSRREYAHFCSVAKGSLMESETLVMLMERSSYVSSQQTSVVHELIQRVSKMSTSLRARLLDSPN